MSRNQNWKHFDVQERDPEETGMHRWLPAAGAAVLVAVLGGAGAWLFHEMSGTSAPPKVMVQQVSVVLPPPPPPPPPQLEDPEPEIEEVEVPEPEPIAEDTSADAPGEDLGLDTDGVAGSDAFGLKAKKGGRGLLGGGDRFAWYAGVLQRDLQAVLSGNEAIRGLGDYAVVVSISLTEEGYVEDSELLSSSNNPQLDAALRQALSAGVRMSREPPDDLPQPIRLRITSRS